MNPVTPLLTLGSRQDALDAELLDACGIQALLSLEPVAPPPGIQCQLHLTLRDRQPMAADTLERALDFIHQQINAGRRVLVHCQMGISRSPTLVAAYLHRHQGMPLDEAVTYLHHLRPVVNPHPVLLASVAALLAAPLTAPLAAMGEHAS